MTFDRICPVSSTKPPHTDCKECSHAQIHDRKDSCFGKGLACPDCIEVQEFPDTTLVIIEDERPLGEQ